MHPKAMNKLYGARYERLNDLGGGAQGTVFKVRDVLDPQAPELAIKRLKQNDRCGRFLAEIEALQKIDHPNVVKIIDHSGTGEPGDTKHKYWFAMPLASGNLADRAGLYKGNLDAVLQVALQLAEALKAAHAQGITHRDVKPGNILFPRLDNEVWLSDFGICHDAAAKDRLTDVNEVVGPRGFTAPELEAGGQVSISSTVDLYSLGKVIFYMLSGGGRIAREELGSPSSNSAFAQGQRYALLRTLLSRLIAPANIRMQTASQVVEELRRIISWDQQAVRLPLAPDVIAKFDAIQQNATRQVQIRTENARIIELQTATIEAVSEALLPWLETELSYAKAHIEGGGTFEAEVGNATIPQNAQFGAGPRHDMFFPISGRQISFLNKGDPFSVKFLLKLMLCETRSATLQFGNHAVPRSFQDPKLALVPYITEERSPAHHSLPMQGFVKDRMVLQQFQRENAARMGRNAVLNQEPYIAATFVGEPINLLHRFAASEWPGAVEPVRNMLSKAFDVFLDYATSTTRSVGR
jgi:serine/threonine protein kinase